MSRNVTGIRKLAKRNGYIEPPVPEVSGAAVSGQRDVSDTIHASARTDQFDLEATIGGVRDLGIKTFESSGEACADGLESSKGNVSSSPIPCS